MTSRSFIFLALVSLFPLVHAQTPNTIDRQSSIFPVIIRRVWNGVSFDGLETPIQIRWIVYVNIAMWNAWANYHPTAVDIFGRSRFKRPNVEHTRDNKNIAILYAIYRVHEASPQSFGDPAGLTKFRQLINEMGLDPDNQSTDLSTPIGIGNREGRDTARLMSIDGWNAAGDLTGKQSNYKIPFQDFSGYTPRNDPWNIKFPFKWQPLLESNGAGFFFRQEHVAPYAGAGISFGYTRDEVDGIQVVSPYENGDATVRSASRRDVKTLRENAKDVFRTSAKLTEKHRVFAEFFDNKVRSFVTSDNPGGVLSIAGALRFALLAPTLDWNMDEDLINGLAANMASFDALILVWKEKRRIDAIRPTDQTMQWLFGDRKFSVWGGPGNENVKISASEWRPYLRSMPHSEFPSASACLCKALVDHALIVSNNTNDIPYRQTVAQGSSRFYPGQIPAKDFVIELKTLKQWSRMCGKSRLWAGVHFGPAIKAGRQLCKTVGGRSHAVVERLVTGTSDMTWLSWLPADTERFWEEP